MRPERPPPPAVGTHACSPRDIYSTMYMLGGGQSQPGERDTGGTGLGLEGLHISVALPSSWKGKGSFLRRAWQGQRTSAAKALPPEVRWQVPQLCPLVPSWQEVRNDRLGIDCPQIPQPYERRATPVSGSWGQGAGRWSVG